MDGIRSSVSTVSIFTHFVILQYRVRSLDGANYNSHNRKEMMLVIILFVTRMHLILSAIEFT